MTVPLPRTRKQAKRERRAAERLGIDVGQYRTHLEAKADRERNGYRRRKRAAEVAARTART